MILALPLLALAVSRRMRHEAMVKKRLEAQERDQPQPLMEEPYNPPLDEYPEDEEVGAADGNQAATEAPDRPEELGDEPRRDPPQG
jgi:hypothetical protein